MNKCMLVLLVAMLSLSVVPHSALAGGSDSGGSDSGGSDSGGSDSGDSDSGDSGSSGSDSRGTGYGPKPSVKAQPKVQSQTPSTTTPAVNVDTKIDTSGNSNTGSIASSGSGADGAISRGVEGTAAGSVAVVDGVQTVVDPVTYKIKTVVFNGPYCKDWDFPNVFFLPIPLPKGGTITIPKSDSTAAIRQYIRTNYVALETELAAGSGPRLDGLFDLMGCAAKAKPALIKSVRDALAARSKTPAYKSNSQQANADEMFKHLMAVAHAYHAADCSQL